MESEGLIGKAWSTGPIKWAMSNGAVEVTNIRGATVFAALKKLGSTQGVDFAALPGSGRVVFKGLDDKAAKTLLKKMTRMLENGGVVGMSQLAEDLNRILAEGAPSFGAAQEAARRLFENIRPGSTRKSAIKAILYAVTRDTWLMDWFSVAARGNHFSYHTVGDVLGEVVQKWKEDWELDEDEFDSLSVDDEVVKGIRAAAMKWKGGPGGPASLPGINWTQVDHLVSGIQNRVRSAQNGNQRSVRDLRKWVDDLQKELKV